jgi:endonuclease/exonuclease/phosphatase family metal-dependent hydrolase
MVFGKGLLTFPSDAPKIKLDYVFVSKDIKVKSVAVPTDIVSDHFPFVAEIEVEF